YNSCCYFCRARNGSSDTVPLEKLPTPLSTCAAAAALLSAQTNSPSTFPCISRPITDAHTHTHPYIHTHIHKYSDTHTFPRTCAPAAANGRKEARSLRGILGQQHERRRRRRPVLRQLALSRVLLPRLQLDFARRWQGASVVPGVRGRLLHSQCGRRLSKQESRWWRRRHAEGVQGGAPEREEGRVAVLRSPEQDNDGAERDSLADA
ncbi:hypothetical protein B0J12DRAFT_302629, partial [Macrophomina phaseolina]